MNLQRNNHYLPECYQQGFTDDVGRVWVKFGDKAPIPRNPRSVGRKRNFYIRRIKGTEDDAVERFFGRHVETSFAGLMRRIKDEREKFAEISGQERGALLLFVASQAVRTVSHKHCMDAQAGRPIDQTTFLNTMLRQMQKIADLWLKNTPKLRFFTTLPYVGEYFIAGDNPVLIIYLHDNLLWTPGDDPQQRITQLNDLMTRRNCGFWLPLSPYVCVSVQPQDGFNSFLPPECIEPQRVRMLNRFLRGQSKEFILARGPESLS